MNIFKKSLNGLFKYLNEIKILKNFTICIHHFKLFSGWFSFFKLKFNIPNSGSKFSYSRFFQWELFSLWIRMWRIIPNIRMFSLIIFRNNFIHINKWIFTYFWYWLFKYFSRSSTVTKSKILIFFANNISINHINKNIFNNNINFFMNYEIISKNML